MNLYQSVGRSKNIGREKGLPGSSTVSGRKNNVAANVKTPNNAIHLAVLDGHIRWTTIPSSKAMTALSVISLANAPVMVFGWYIP